MTKKDFELIASALRDDAAHLAPDACDDYSQRTDWEKGAYDQWNTTALAIARALATTNPRFDRARFLEACGVAS